jgi:hypothetical protein
MSEEKEKSPMFALKDIKAGKEAKPVKMKLDCAKAIATGDGNFGKPWQLWVAFIENVNVTEGKGKDATKLSNYSGKVVFFPTEKLNQEIEQLCNGNTGVEVEIGKEFYETADGKPGFTYTVKKLSDGVPGTPSLTQTEKDILEDVRDYIKNGYQITYEQFVAVTKDPSYKYTEDEARIKELFKLL